MTGGLNAGNELDNDDLFVNPVANEWPELEGELRLVVATEDQQEDLAALAADLEAAGGMNQDFAMEAERLSPGLLVNDRTPLGFYSMSTTATRYRVSLEELSKGIWALIAAGIAAALALVWKLYKWFSGDKSEDGGGGGTSGGELADNHEKAADTVAEIKRAMETGGREKTSDGDSLENVARDLQVRRDTKIYNFLHEQNEAVSELLGDKGLHHTLSNVADALPKINAAFAQKYNLLNKMIREDFEGIILAQKQIHTKTTELTSGMESRQAIVPLAVAPFNQEIKGSLQEMTEKLKAEFDTKVAQPHKIGDNYDTVLRNLAKAMTGQGIIHTLRERDEWTAQIERFREDLEFWNDRYVKKPDAGGDQSLSIEVADHVKRAITHNLQDITAITRLHQIVSKASQMMQGLCVQTISVTESLISELKSRAKNGGYEIPEDVVEIEARLKILREEAKKKDKK